MIHSDFELKNRPAAKQARTLRHSRGSQRGVALVITLIMLSIVTILTVAFLGVSQRERGSVTATANKTDARMMAEAGLARAEAEIMSHMLAMTNRFDYGLLVSTNLISAGFTATGVPPPPVPTVPPAAAWETNVAYQYVNGAPLSYADLLTSLSSLLYDPRPPVFIRTNVSGGEEFRFYLDFNRNGIFETNGVLPELNSAGNIIGSRFYTGDPEWIGLLEYPQVPHGPTNRFIGRYAYLVLPAGKSFDLNFIHNQAKRPASPVNTEGFLRDHGFGSWELNLAGFLVGLNTNGWPGPVGALPADVLTVPPRVQYNYRTASTASGGSAFEDAFQLLRYRYNGSYAASLASVTALYGTAGYNAFNQRTIDAYADGDLPLSTPGLAGGPLLPNVRNDDPDLRWPGSPNVSSEPLAYHDVQELFAPLVPSYAKSVFPGPSASTPGPVPYASFTWALTNLMRPARLASHDRYTFYRMLDQLGVDSAPLPSDTNLAKINLNFDNLVQVNSQGVASETNFYPWRAIDFFTVTADRLFNVYSNELKDFFGGAYPATGLSVTNIPIYPASLYTPGVHRLLQLAANIYDAKSIHMTNIGGVNYPAYPTVFRPVFTKQNNQVYISGYVEVTNAPSAAGTFFSSPSNPWYELPEAVTTSTLADGVHPNINIFGIPVVVGAKKGLPNFNEFAMQTWVVAARRLQAVRPAGGGRPTETNVATIITVSNIFGMEILNSYTQAYARPLDIQATNICTYVITNKATGQLLMSNRVVMPFTTKLGIAGGLGASSSYNTRIPANALGGNKFITNWLSLPILPDSVYVEMPTNGFAAWPKNVAAQAFLFQPLTPGVTTPEIGMSVTNMFQCLITDPSLDNRVIDCVNLTNLIAHVDVSRLLAPPLGGTPALPNPGGAPVNIQLRDLWDTNLMNGSSTLTRGAFWQMFVSTQPPGAYNSSGWNFTAYPLNPLNTTNIINTINPFRVFNGLQSLIPGASAPASATQWQTPFVPAIRRAISYQWQANDPLIHYTSGDLMLTNDPSAQYMLPVSSAKSPWDVTPPFNIGARNSSYEPWGGRPGGGQRTDLTNNFFAGLKDPGVTRSDDWDFPSNDTTPTNQFGNIGWLGRVHRGTPWQTIYAKSDKFSDDGGKTFYTLGSNTWYRWSGSYETQPTNDWKLFDLFTVAANDNAERSLLSVNQTNLAAWSAALGGVLVLSNAVQVPQPNNPLVFSNLVIEPNSPQLLTIVKAINDYRTNYLGNVYTTLGSILSVPELTTMSPYLNLSGDNPKYTFNDAAYERIPQQVLSLLHVEPYPRFVIYAYGQSLKPADRSIIVALGAYRGMCTNYQITGEVATRTVLRVENMPNTVGTTDIDKNKLPRIVVEDFKVLPALDY